MAEGLHGRPGGILGLCQLLDEHAEAIESDLLDNGWRLDDLLVTYSWRDLLVMVRRFINRPGSALSEEMRGHVLWSDSENLLATLIDAVQIGNWQYASKGNKRHIPKPKPIERPGSKGRKGKHFGSDPVPVSKFWGWWNKAGKKAKKSS